VAPCHGLIRLINYWPYYKYSFKSQNNILSYSRSFILNLFDQHLKVYLSILFEKYIGRYSEYYDFGYFSITYKVFVYDIYLQKPKLPTIEFKMWLYQIAYYINLIFKCIWSDRSRCFTFVVIALCVQDVNCKVYNI